MLLGSGAAMLHKVIQKPAPILSHSKEDCCALAGSQFDLRQRPQELNEYLFGFTRAVGNEAIVVDATRVDHQFRFIMSDGSRLKEWAASPQIPILFLEVRVA